MIDRCVSILIPCFQAEDTIRGTLSSVFSQTYVNIEVIVIDDGSTDRSKEYILNEFGDRVLLISQDNCGPSAARNLALVHAKGEWVIFLDADDCLESDFVEVQVIAAKLAGADICFGDSVMTWPSGRRVELLASEARKGVDFALSQVLSNRWCHLMAILWRTSFVRGLGGWDVSMRRNDDGELIARALLQNIVMTSSTGSRAIYRQHDAPGRVSARNDWAAVASQIAFCECLDQHLLILGNLPMARKSVARQAHVLANECYFLGFDDLGFRAERLARQDGRLQPIPCSALHKFGVTLLGIRGKQRLSRVLALIRSRFLLVQSPERHH